MANPQPNDPNLRVAHSIVEAMLLRDFDKRAIKVINLILRLSWGCNKKSATIKKTSDFSVIGIGPTHIMIVLNFLIQSKVITVSGDQYAFNKDFDEWQVSRLEPFQPEKLTTMVSLNLKSYHDGNSDTPKSYHNGKSEKPPTPEATYHDGNIGRRETGTAKERLLLKKDYDNDNSNNHDDVLKVFKENIGESNQAILKDIEKVLKTVSPDWVIDALRNTGLQPEAKRTWPYTKGTLNNWITKGRQPATGGPVENKYTTGPFSHLVKKGYDDQP